MHNILKYLYCLMVGALVLPTMQAQNIIRPKIAGPNNLWVNSYNGVLFFGITDMQTSSSAMPMELRFYYNSSASNTDYGYGLGFSLGYEMRYEEDVIGGVTIERGDGRKDHYTKFGDEYQAPAGVFNTLSRPEFNKYLLTTKTGDKYYFDNATHHKVTAIEDRNGNKTTFVYQDSLLVEIKDAVGHTITLSYTDGLLRRASATFSQGDFSYEYDGLRRLRKRIDPIGNVTLYDYNRQNKLNEITDANGNKTLIAYNNSGMVSRLKTDVSDKSIRYDGDKTVYIDYSEPNNVYSYYRWDSKGREIERAGLCCGIQSKLEYDEDDNVVRQTDGNNNSTTYTYDEYGNMLSVTDALANTEQFTYESDYNQITSFRDKNGNTYSFSYDAKGNLTSYNGPLGQNNTYTYNVQGWPIMLTDSKGGVTRNTYNADGTIANVLYADGGVTHYSYDQYGRMTSTTDPIGNITSYSYDALGRIICRTDALGNTVTATYDKVGNIVRVKDAANHISAYTYDALGNITSKIDACGNETNYEYDGRSNIISISDPLGNKQYFEYNDRNKTISYTNGVGEKTSYDYDANGNLVAIMPPNGNVISLDWNDINQLITVSDNIGLVSEYTYDANGNILSVTDGLDRKVSYTYDALNRLTSEMLSSGNKTQYEYDTNSNMIATTDGLGHVTNNTFDARNRIKTHTNALNAKSCYSYDLNGNLTMVSDALNHTTTYSFDALNRVVSTTYADGKTILYFYDNSGNIIQLKDRAGHIFKFTYDAIGNLLSKKYADGNQEDFFAYDSKGRLITANNKDAAVVFTYDGADRLLSENLNGKTTLYSYDVAEGKKTITYPSGMKIVENLNARGLISSILQNGTEIVSMQYNVAGQKTKQSYANGVITNYEYNDNAWISQINDNHNMIGFKMSYDAIGNIIKREDLFNANRTESYGYDAISQITSFSRGPISESWEYDLLGNRVKSLANGVTTNYQSNNVNAYTSISGGINILPQYDGNGNMTSDGEHQYQYDQNNHIITTSDMNMTYKYDALGRRIAKGSTLYFFAGNQMIEEISDDITTSYVFGNSIDETLQMKRGNETYYYHKNHLGSTMTISDRNANLVERMEYNPFGKTTFLDLNGLEIESSTINNKTLFTGRDLDQENGNYYFRARSMNPKFGKFMQHDPLGYINGLNDYSYINNSSVNIVDPYGLFGIFPTNPCDNRSLCDKMPYLPVCKDACKKNPNLRWCKDGGGGGGGNPNSDPLFNPPMGDNGLKNNWEPSEGSGNNWNGFASQGDNINDWINGPHPYMDNLGNHFNNMGNNVKDWYYGPHPYIKPIAIGIGIGIVYAAAIYLTGGGALILVPAI